MIITTNDPYNPYYIANYTINNCPSGYYLLSN